MLTSKHIATPHGMFNRHKGVSPSPFNSNNLSLGVGDEPDNVLQNRASIKDKLGIKILVSARQDHTDRICCADHITSDTEVDGYDALMTSKPGVGLLIQQADCQAILLEDVEKKVIAAIHCGWRGSVLNIIGKTIDHMTAVYSTDPADLRALISPSLGPCCAEFVHYRTELPAAMHSMQERPGYFDFWKISADQLTASGVSGERIVTMNICTACHPDFFSYRRSARNKRPTGRQGSVIALEG